MEEEIYKVSEIVGDSYIYAHPSKKWCIEIASKLPFQNLAELFDRAERISEYCKEKVG